MIIIEAKVMKILGNCALNPFGIILSNSILLYKIDKILSKVTINDKELGNIVSQNSLAHFLEKPRNVEKMIQENCFFAYPEIGRASCRERVY